MYESQTQSDQELRLRLELPSVPGSVGLVRGVLRTIVRSSGLDADRAEDMLLAISEACNNVVLHAYPGAHGPLIFSIAVKRGWIEATVRDQGAGIRPGPARNRGLGMGVTLINTVADRAEFESSELGTEVRIRFRRPVQQEQPVSRLSLWTAPDLTGSSALRAQSD